MLEQLQADCLKSHCRITASKARLLQEVKVGYLLDPETKQQSSKWYATSSPLPKTYQTAKLNSKVFLIAFFGSEGITDDEFVLGGQLGVLQAVFRPGKWRNGCTLCHNTPSHTAVVVHQFLMERHFT
jgi:hypothetical protein